MVDNATPITDRRHRYKPGAPRLLGRGPILSEIESALDPSWPHPLGTVVLQGKPGHGKTALTNAVAHVAAQRGLEVVRTRCVEGDQARPNRLLADMLSQLEGSGPKRLIRDMVDDHDVLTAGISERLAARPSGTVLITIDDAQWVDPPSAMWLLEFCRRRVHEDRVHVVVALEPRRHGNRATALDRLLFEHHARLFTLEPLSAECVRMMVGDRFGDCDPALAEELHRQTGGVPALVVLTVNEWLDTNGDGDLRAVSRAVESASIVRWILTRIGSLPATAYSLLESVSVLGPGADFRVAAAAASIDGTEAARISDELADLDVLSPGRSLSFRYEAVRSSVYAGIPVDRRWEIHQFAAEVLSARGSVRPAADHLVQTEPRNNAWAARTLTDAARAAMESGDVELAKRYAQRAFAETVGMPANPELSLVLAQLAAKDGDPAVIDHLEAAISQQADVVSVANTGLALVDHLWDTPLRNRLLDVLNRLHDELSASAPEVAVRLQLVEVLAERRRPSGSVLADRTWTDDRSRGPGGDVFRIGAALTALEACAAGPGRTYAEVMQTIRESVTIDVVTRATRRWAASAIVRVLAGVVRMGAIADVGPLLKVAHNEAVRGERQLDAIKLLLLIAETHAMRGRLDEADRALVEVTNAVPASSPWRHSAQIGRALLMRLRTESLVAFEPTVELDADRWRMVGPLFDSHGAEQCGRLHLTRQEWQPALDDFSNAELLAGVHKIENPALTSWRIGRVACLVGLGDLGPARGVAEQNLQLARAFGAPVPIARGLRALASTLPPDERVVPLEEAAQLLEGRSSVVDRCCTMMDLGRARREVGDILAARAVLRDAADIAVRIDAASLVRDAAEELHASGARPRRLHLRGSDALTPAERRVALLAAEGMTNGGIATSLYISMKTVESHLARAYRKLGVKSRAELAGLFGLDPRLDVERASDPSA